MVSFSIILLLCSGSFLEQVRCIPAPEVLLERSGVVPDVIDETPPNIVQVSFDGRRVLLGTILTPTQTKNPPRISYSNDPEAFYVLCFVDPDTGTKENPSDREFVHWLVGNIPGDNVENGETLAKYIRPATPKGTGFHRYVIVVFKQPEGEIDFTEEQTRNLNIQQRAQFKTKDFAKKYQLGDPLGVNFFRAEFDDSVPETLKQLGVN